MSLTRGASGDERVLPIWEKSNDTWDAKLLFVRSADAGT